MEDIDIIAIIVALVGSGVLSTIITLLANRQIRKKEIEIKEARVKEIGAATAKALAEASGAVIQELREQVKCLDLKVAALRNKNRELVKRTKDLEIKYEQREEYVQKLRHRVKLLAKLLTRIFTVEDPHLTLEDIINGFTITEGDREFLEEIVSEVNNKD